jgi:hypothetical protein
MNPYIVDESQSYDQERVDEVEAWRLELTAQVVNIGVYDQVRATIGECPLAWGMRVKTQATLANASH